MEQYWYPNRRVTAVDKQTIIMGGGVSWRLFFMGPFSSADLLTCPMLRLLDYFYTFLHLAIVGFNLLGWIWPSTRKAHLVLLTATLISWFLLGVWFGWGYCPVTDWQWEVKEKLGETDLPNSFIKYFADKISGKDFPAPLVDRVTLISFLLIVVVTVYVNFIRKPSSGSRR